MSDVPPSAAQLAIADENAKEPDSVIATIYSMFLLFCAARTALNIGMSDNPSGLIKFAARMAILPLANRVANRYKVPAVRTAAQVVSACVDPVGTVVSYGAQAAANLLVKRTRLGENKHTKAATMVIAQETGGMVTTAAKQTHIYKASSDRAISFLVRQTEGTPVASGLQMVRNSCAAFDKSATVRSVVMSANNTFAAVKSCPGISHALSALEYGTKKVDEAISAVKQQLRNNIAGIASLGNRIKEWDKSTAVTIRNSNILSLSKELSTLKAASAELETKRTAAEAKEAKWESRSASADDLAEWNERRALKGKPPLTRHDAIAKASIKQRSAAAALSRTEQRLHATDTLLDLVQSHLQADVAHHRALTLPDELNWLGLEQGRVQGELYAARNAGDEGRIRSLEAELFGLEATEYDVLEMLYGFRNPDAPPRNDSDALGVDEVEVYVWYPTVGADHVRAPQLVAAAQDFTNRTIGTRGVQSCGHMSLRFRGSAGHDTYVSHWPNEEPRKGNLTVPSRANTYEQDVEQKERPPDRTFRLTGLDVTAMRVAYRDEVAGTPYHITLNSCCGTTMKVLTAGGIELYLNFSRTFDVLRRLIPSPDGVSAMLENAEVINRTVRRFVRLPL